MMNYQYKFKKPDCIKSFKNIGDTVYLVQKRRSSSGVWEWECVMITKESRKLTIVSEDSGIWNLLMETYEIDF